MNTGSKLVGECETGTITLQGVITHGIVADGHDGGVKVASVAGPDLHAVGLGACPLGCGVAGTQERQVDHADARHVLVHETQGDTAQRDAV